jgi:alkylhydroperoxidase/carboxymuconolactone decarboxylase family protein YurZ/quinol monooxygenase YgiN
LEKLDTELRSGLEAGLTVSQLRTSLEQLYAYCGFPRSLNGITTLKKVVEDRKKLGIRDAEGKHHEPATCGDRYERGRATLERLTGTPQAKPAPGFGEFSPEIDRFLKEHLFADIFDNQILTSRERELLTIAALTAMTGVEAQLKSHISIGKNTGITDAQLTETADLIEQTVNRTQANQLRKLLGLAEPPVMSEGMLVRISEIEVSPETPDEYLAILKEEARKSVESEPGVIGIFPMTKRNKPTQVRIVEIYRDKAAYDANIASPHFQHYKTSTFKMVKSLELVDMEVLDSETMQRIFEKLK